MQLSPTKNVIFGPYTQVECIEDAEMILTSALKASNFNDFHHCSNF